MKHRGIICLLLALCLLLGVPLSVAAQEDVYQESWTTEAAETSGVTDIAETAEPTESEETINPVDPTESTEITETSESVTDETETVPSEPQSAEENPIVATIYLCAKAPSWSMLFGHVWIYIENVSQETLQVGVYELPPQQGVSVGSFGLRADGNGTYYNVEAYCGNAYGVNGMMAIRDALTKRELIAVSDKIQSRNFYGFFTNCAAFASAAWNAGSSKKVVPLLFPFMTQLQIAIHGNLGFVSMFVPSRDQVFKQIGTGSEAYLRTCSEKTISKRI